MNEKINEILSANFSEVVFQSMQERKKLMKV